MTTQTYRFVCEEESDTDDGDAMMALLREEGEKQGGESQQDAKPSRPDSARTEQHQAIGENNNNAHLTPSKVSSKNKKMDKKKVKVKSVKDGVKQLEKHELVKKRRAIVYQLAATSVIAMLHGLSMVPYFWNSILLNVHDLQTQTITMWCLFLGCLVSCIFTPMVLKRFPMRWILCCGCITAAVLSAARFYPKLYLMVPASALHGLSLVPFYTAVFSHISKLSVQYEGYQGNPYRDTVVTFTAVCTGILSCAPFLLSLFRVIILNVVSTSHPPLPPTSSECGFNYLWDWMDKLKAQNGLSPDLYEARSVLGACVVCTLGGIVLIFVVLEEYQLPSHEMGEQPQQQMAMFCEKLKDANHILLFPIAFSVGMFETFCYTLYGQAFVACNFDTDDIFYIVLGMSLVAIVLTAPFAYGLPRAASLTVTVAVYISSLLLLMIIIIGGYMSYIMFYFLALLLGKINYLLLTQSTGFILLHFMSKIDVSLSVFYFAKLSAFLLTFLFVRYHGDNSTCTGAVLAALLIGLICYVVLELRVRQQSQSDQSIGESVGAYVLLESQKAPWLPSVDPTTVDTAHVETMNEQMA